MKENKAQFLGVHLTLRFSRTITSRLFFILGLLVIGLFSTFNLDHSQPQAAPANDPPFWGTIFISPDIITDTDPSTFQNLIYTGQGIRTMFDRRVNEWVNVNAFLFNTTFTDSLSIEVQVNPEFGTSQAAAVEAKKYALVIGRLPTVLRSDVQTVSIHLGFQLFGGGNKNLLIHTGQGEKYAADGILEEALVHEAAHTSLDATHAAAPGWLAAQSADNNYISNYARDFPNREDVAESFLPYMAIRYRAQRLDPNLVKIIKMAIPNRMTYFDQQGFDLYPLVSKTLPLPLQVIYLLLLGNSVSTE